MGRGTGDDRDFRIAGLSNFQSGVAFLLIATAIYLYVLYQVLAGRVFTKSGEMELGPGLPWAWLALETVGATVGVVRGVKMIRRGS
jgi:hypothetical protein